ncbi:MAG: YdeI/OmpD-associated family protein [Flavobacteriales bacterium]|nr:YdeI/OmpD-associated family protein [Flavobacteriales bacterium]
MGDGDFIIPFNAQMRKGTGKQKGDSVLLQLDLEQEEKKISEDLLMCLAEVNENLERFLSLPKGHQNYYSNWVESAKTTSTKSDRIMKTIFAMEHEMDYGQMIRHFKNKS